MKGEREVDFRLGDYDRAKALTIDPVLVFSTYLGGRRDDQGLGIAADSSGAAYITGVTTSGDFPIVAGTQRPSGSLSDAFVTKLNPAGSAIVYSTYLGGNGRRRDHGHPFKSSCNSFVESETGTRHFLLPDPF